MTDPWNAAELAHRDSWNVRLSDEAAAELRRFARAPGPPRDRLNDMRLPDGVLTRLRLELRGLHEELRSGSGVALLRGLPIHDLAGDELARMCWAIGRLFGVGLAQNLKGELLGDVTNLADQQASARPFQNGGGLIMHRDPVDVVGLLCVRHAKSGGLSRIVSAREIHDLMNEERPDLLMRLYEGFVYHRLDEDRGSAAAFTPHPVPVFERDSQGAVGCFFIPGPIQRAGSMGYPIDALGREALARFVELSEQPGLYFDMNLEPGDMQFLNNRVVLHGRTDYEDHPELERRRYMLRLWLDQPEWPALDPRQQFFEDKDHFDRQAALLRSP